jgi:Na+-translocating ferredoxin:NAD+ oxidoreductase RnfG subunit
MKAFALKIVTVASALGLIAGISALAIGVTYAFTIDKINANGLQKEKAGLSEVYGDKADTFDSQTLSANASYVSKIWIAKEATAEVGYIYKTDGKNSYGEVSMLLGISGSGNYGTMVILTNTETYGSTLTDNYIDPYNATADKTTALSNVHCGATYGATLINNMASEAMKDYLSRKTA